VQSSETIDDACMGVESSVERHASLGEEHEMTEASTLAPASPPDSLRSRGGGCTCVCCGGAVLVALTCECAGREVATGDGGTGSDADKAGIAVMAESSGAWAGTGAARAGLEGCAPPTSGNEVEGEDNALDAPAESSIFTIALWPAASARQSGVLPDLSSAFKLAL
jgi:hypothetical protein